MRFFVIILILVGIALFAGCAQQTGNGMQASTGSTASVSGDSAAARSGPMPIAEVPLTPQEPHIVTEDDKSARLMKIARSARDKGDIKTAVQFYERAAATHGSDITPYLELADLYTGELQQTGRARAMLGAAAMKHADDPDMLRQIAKRLVEAGGFNQAVLLYDRALSARPGDPLLFNGKGVALDMLGQHANAQHVYKEGLGVDADNLLLANNLGLSYILSTDYAQAIALLEPLVENAEAHNIRQNLALAYGLSGDMDMAYEVGAKNLTPKQVEENIAFYRSYSSDRRKKNNVATPPPIMLEHGN